MQEIERKFEQNLVCRAERVRASKPPVELPPRSEVVCPSRSPTPAGQQSLVNSAQSYVSTCISRQRALCGQPVSVRLSVTCPRVSAGREHRVVGQCLSVCLLRVHVCQQAESIVWSASVCPSVCYVSTCIGRQRASCSRPVSVRLSVTCPRVSAGREHRVVGVVGQCLSVCLLRVHVYQQAESIVWSASVCLSVCLSVTCPRVSAGREHCVVGQCLSVCLLRVHVYQQVESIVWSASVCLSVCYVSTCICRHRQRALCGQPVSVCLSVTCPRVSAGREHCVVGQCLSVCLYRVHVYQQAESIVWSASVCPSVCYVSTCISCLL